MGQKYIDDVTGEEIENEDKMQVFGVGRKSGRKEQLDRVIVVRTETYANQPEAVAEELHRKVDQWLDDQQEYLDREAKDVLTTCEHCRYQWHYAGDKNRATCPDCGSKTDSAPYPHNNF